MVSCYGVQCNLTWKSLGIISDSQTFHNARPFMSVPINPYGYLDGETPHLQP